jgi:hypothetical protein
MLAMGSIDLDIITITMMDGIIPIIKHDIFPCIDKYADAITAFINAFIHNDIAPTATIQ